MASQQNMLNYSCNNGDYYHNDTDRDLQVCSSGKNISLY